MRNYYLLLVMTILLLPAWHSTLQAQQQVMITGVAKDKAGLPMIGVNVVEKGTTNGSITDLDGRFSVQVNKANTVLTFSFIGYLSQEINTGGKRVINVIMEEDTKTLDEVVVVGYGTARKRDLTGAISSVKAEN